MAVSSVSPAVASQQQQYPVARPSEDLRAVREGATQQTQARPTQNEAPQGADRSQQVQRAVQSEQAQRQEQTKPVVNDQGQKTGTIINTTA